MSKNKEAEDCYRLILRHLDRMSELKRKFDADMAELQKDLKIQLDKRYPNENKASRYQLLYDNLKKEKNEIAQFDRMVEDGF